MAWRGHCLNSMDSPCRSYNHLQRVVSIDNDRQVTGIPLVSVASDLNSFVKLHPSPNLKNHGKRRKVPWWRNALFYPLEGGLCRKQIRL